MNPFYLCYQNDHSECVAETFPDNASAVSRYNTLQQTGCGAFLLFHIDNGENLVCEDAEYTDPDEARCYILVIPRKTGGYTWCACTAASANAIMRQNENSDMLAFHRNTSDI